MAILSLSQPETISIGRKLGASFERDKADFVAHSSRFADPFGAEYVALNDEVEALPTVRGVNSELKKAIKFGLENEQIAIFDLTNLIEIRL